MALAEFLKQIDLDELYNLNVRSTAREQKAHEERGAVLDADISPCTVNNNGGGDGDGGSSGGESQHQGPTISTSSQGIDSSEVLPSGPVLSPCLPPRKTRRNKRPRDDYDDPAADTVFTPPKRLLRSTASVLGERLHSVIEELYDLVPEGKRHQVQDGNEGLATGKPGGGILSTTEMVERAVEHLRKLQEGGLSSTSSN